MNNNKGAQHGRQPPPQQTAPPTDPRTDPRIRNQPTSSSAGDSHDGICRDFIWGICSIGAECIYRHELEYETMKNVLKFCHDHQNRTGCLRPDCTYLHTSREEENLFLTTGQIPRALMDRYTGVTSGFALSGENVPPHAMIYEYIVQPPPPPPPGTPVSIGPGGLSHSPMQLPLQASMMMQGPMQNPMQGPMQNPMQGPMHNPMQGPMPVPAPMQGPMPGQMQGPMQGPMPVPAPMQGPMPGQMQGPVQGPMPVPAPMQGPMPGQMQGPMQGPMPVPAPMQGPMPGQMQGPMQGPMPVPAPMQGPMPGQMQGPMQGPMPVPAPMQGPMPGQMQGPMQGPMPVPAPMQGPMPGQMQGPMQGPMPVPAPMPPMPAPMPPLPPPPSMPSVSSMRMAGPVYRSPLPPAQPNMTSVYHPAITQQSSLPPMFDPTRPPPSMQAAPGLKRPGEDCEAGPSKLRKSESSNDSSCENCVQRLIRTDRYYQQVDQIQQEHKNIRTEIGGKLDCHERNKLLLRTLINPEMYRHIIEFIEKSLPVHFSTSVYNAPSNMLANDQITTVTNSTNNKVHDLLEMLVGKSARTSLDCVPSTSPDEAASLLTGRSHSSNGSNDLLSNLIKYISNMPSTPTSASGDADLSRPSNSSNGFNRFMSESTSPPGPNGSRFPPGRPYGDLLTTSDTARPFPDGPRTFGDGAAGGPSLNARSYSENVAGSSTNRAYAEGAVVPSNPYDSAPSTTYAEDVARQYGDHATQTRYQEQTVPPRQYHPSICEGATVPPSVPSAAAPPVYMSGNYSPTQSVGRFYSHFPTNNMPNPPYPGIVMSQAPRPPMPPHNAQNPYFIGGRYPNQHYYPPYQ